MVGAPKLLRLPEAECPVILIRLPRSRSPKSWDNIPGPVVPLERTLYGHPSAGLLWERKFGDALFEEGWEKGALYKYFISQKCVERYCELANKTVEHLCKVSTPSMDDRQFNKRDFETKNIRSLPAHRVELPVSSSHWPTGHLARSVTKWNRACNKRFERLISSVHHAGNYRPYCHVGNRASEYKLGLFQDADVAGNLTDSKSTSGGVLYIFGGRTFVPISWSCKKQTADSNSSTEAEIISWDAGLRMEGIPGSLWNTVNDVLDPTARGDLQQRPKHCKPKKQVGHNGKLTRRDRGVVLHGPNGGDPSPEPALHHFCGRGPDPLVPCRHLRPVFRHLRHRHRASWNPSSLRPCSPRHRGTETWSKDFITLNQRRQLLRVHIGGCTSLFVSVHNQVQSRRDFQTSHMKARRFLEHVTQTLEFVSGLVFAADVLVSQSTFHPLSWADSQLFHGFAGVQHVGHPSM